MSFTVSGSPEESKTKRFVASSEEHALPRELNHLLYSPPPSEAGSEASGLFDIASLLSAEVKTPEGGDSGVSDVLHAAPLMAGEDRFVKKQLPAVDEGYLGGFERTGGRPVAAVPPYPDWQLTPPPENHHQQHQLIKEEQKW